MKPWSGGAPNNIQGLFDFYHEYVKLLYSYVQTQNEMPQEMLFELNAAFDHLSRIWTYKQPEEDACRKAFSHLKRACLDAFKIKLLEARSQYDQLCAVDTSAIDNGDYDHGLHVLWNRIQHDAIEARRLEGRDDQAASVPAFDAWEAVFINCMCLEKEFFLHSRLDWAKRRTLLKACRYIFVGITVAVCGYALRTAMADQGKLPMTLAVGAPVMLLISLGWWGQEAGLWRKLKAKIVVPGAKQFTPDAPPRDDQKDPQP